MTSVAIMRRATIAGVGLVALAGCHGTAAQSDAASPLDAPRDAVLDAPSDAPGDAGDKAAPCAATFANDLTPGFGRLDGTILAVVPPGDQACALPNSTHLVIQATFAGKAYRLVVDVLSNQGSPDVDLHELDAPLVGGAWAEGWHTGVALDYVTDLAVHSDAFVPTHEAALVTAITAELELGAHVSVFATSGSAEPSSAHLVHRNLTSKDGAIVIHPDGAAPHYVLLRFGEQSF